MPIKRKGRRSLGRCSETKVSLMRREGPGHAKQIAKQFGLYSNDNGKLLLSDLRRSNTGTIIQFLIFND